MPPANWPRHGLLAAAAVVLLVSLTSDPVVVFGVLTVAAAVFAGRQYGRRSQAEQALRMIERRVRHLLEDVHEGVLVVDDHGGVRHANRRAEELGGYSAAELLDLRITDLLRSPGPAPPDPQSGEMILVRKNGTQARVAVRGGDIGAGRRQLIVGEVPAAAAVDAATLDRLADLTRAERKYREMFENAADGIFQTTPDGQYIEANPALARMYGYASPAELVAGVANIAGEVYVDPGRRAEFARLVETDGRVVWFESQVRRKDGQVIWVSENARAVRDEAGRLLYYEGFQRDVSDRKALEAQVQQAQKMDAVGRLAGGIAHDFNNILTIINGYADLLLTRLPPGDPGRGPLEEVRQAGNRAAGLTGQLLAFSRKQVVQPRVLDLNAVVADVERMLGRLIGEDVTLTTVLAPALARVRADRGQIEQVLMNLAVNARDAMPRGGRLTIETRNVGIGADDAALYPDLAPGGYVQLAVSDTGVGMTAEVRAKIFEPFFTTKEVGKGTGLGLAMVYGIVKTYQGHIGVYSEVGAGTTFKILLPTAAGTTTGPAAGEGRVTPRGTEIVLLVEDDPGVRGVARIALELQGYTVLEAAGGAEALRIADGHPGPVHILVTDVVMPGMGGRDVADALRARYPGLKVLFSSGYTDDAVVRHGVIEATDAFLQKPFTPFTLARKVREVLDGPARDDRRHARPPAAN